MEREEQTFSAVYGRYYHIVYGYLFKRLGNKTEAEDLTADVFVACYEAFGSYDAGKASISTWLFAIVNNRLKNHYRSKRPHVDVEHVAVEDLGVQGDSIMIRSIALAESRRQIAEALRGLSEQHRQVVVYRFFGDMSVAQVADKMQLSEGNVRVILHRALKSMKRHMRMQ